MYFYRTNIFGEKIILLQEGDVLKSFTENPENSDYQDYLVWLAEGNTPEPWPQPD